MRSRCVRCETCWQAGSCGEDGFLDVHSQAAYHCPYWRIGGLRLYRRRIPYLSTGCSGSGMYRMIRSPT